LTEPVLAIVAPGQGAQKPGMLESWLADPALTEKIGGWSDAIGLDLARLGTTAEAEEIRDTAVTQPLVVASALLAAGTLTIPAGAVAAGHSVGELAAAAIAGVIPDVDAVVLAALRGRAMGEACAVETTSMAAVMSPDTELVLAALAERELVGANVNGGGQIVAAGSAAAIDALVGEPPSGMRVIALSVAGAFHTAYMAPAQRQFADRVAALTATDPVRPLLSNSDGSVVADGPGYLELLVSQITSPVRWDSCMATMRELGVTGVLELPPAGTLVGLVKRELKGVATMALKTPNDLDAAAAFIAEHGASA